MKDIIRGMFRSEEDFQKHVTVIFTFSDVAPIAGHIGWLTKILGGLPVPASISYWGKDMSREDLFSALEQV